MKFLLAQFFILVLGLSVSEASNYMDEPNEAQTGSISGRITNEQTGKYLPGAVIKLEDRNKATTSDMYGSFRIAGLQEGGYSLQVSYLGFESKNIRVEVVPGKRARIKIALSEKAMEIDEVVVNDVFRGQARGLNQQKEAESIKNIVSYQQMERFPDLSIAESANRIAGISTDYRRGEASEILVRGLPGSFHNVTINDHRVASSDEVSRSTDASIINSDMVSAIEITKSITPDMDADATSGVINLVTRRPVGDEKIFHVNVGSGYNSLSQLPMWIGSVTYGQRNGKLDWVISGSYQKDQRSTEDIRHDWGVEDFGNGPEDVLARLTSSLYETDRERAGATAHLDYYINERSNLYLMGHYNRFDDYETRNETRHRFADGNYVNPGEVNRARYERDFREQQRITNLFSLNAGGKHDLSLATIDYNLGYSYGSYEIPLRESLSFRHDDRVDYDEIDFSDREFGQFEFSEDFDPYNFNSLGFRHYDRRLDDAYDNNFFSDLNISIPYELSDYSGKVQFGGKYRYKSKERETLERRWKSYDGVLYMSDFHKDKENMIIQDRYELKGDIDWGEAKSFLDDNMKLFGLDETRMYERSDPNNYRARETILAAYALTDITFGQLNINAGVRMEQSMTNYKGNMVVFDDQGDYQYTEGIESDDINHLDFFPMINLKYSPDALTNIRLAYTHSIIRPDFQNLVPYELINHERQVVRMGNPDLKPSTSLNLDLMYEKYLENAGFLSAGVFYKDMADFIYNESTTFSEGVYEGYALERPENGESAFIYGFEASWQQRMRFLPGFLGNTGIYANYTYSKSEAKIIVPQERRIPMPLQAPHVFNLALSYNAGGFSGQISYAFRDTWLHRVGVQDRAPSISQTDDKFLDRYFEYSGHLDLALSYNFTPGLQGYANFKNLSGESHVQYFYDPVYPYRNTFFSWLSTFGVKYRL
jgi:TonB-dependent receptor